MKLVVLKGGHEDVPLSRSSLTSSASTRAPGAVALSGDGGRWVMVNMSPAVADQLSSDARLLRHSGLQETAARAVVLTDAQIDHMTGLLSLRDGVPIHLYATPAVFESLTHALPVLPLLQHYCSVQWHVIPVAGESREAVFRVEGQPTLEFTAVATDGPLPQHVAQPYAPNVGETIALAVRDMETGQRLFCASSLSAAGPDAVAWMQEADCLLLGDESLVPPPTQDDEPVHLLGRRWLDQLDQVHARRKLLLAGLDGGIESMLSLREFTRHGVELATDRMEIEL